MLQMTIGRIRFFEKVAERVDSNSKAAIFISVGGRKTSKQPNNTMKVTKEYSITAMTLNHRGGVTSRSYSTFTGTKDELEAKKTHLLNIYHKVVVEEAK